MSTPALNGVVMTCPMTAPIEATTVPSTSAPVVDNDAAPMITATIGAVIGQVITTPFSAGVDTLLYTDRRIRAEAFDLVLRTGAMGPVAGSATDHLWLTDH